MTAGWGGRLVQGLFTPFPEFGGTFPPVLSSITDDDALKTALKELTRQVDQQSQASDQLAQRAGVVVGLFVATLAAILAITRSLPASFSWFDGITTATILLSIGLGLYATRAQDIRIGPLPKDVVAQASFSVKQARYALLGYRLDDLNANARILNRSSAAHVLAMMLFPFGVLFLLLVVLKGW